MIDETPEDSPAEEQDAGADVPAAADAPAEPAPETPAEPEAEVPAAPEPESDDEDDEPVAPREKPAIPGADLEVDLVAEGADPLAGPEDEELYGAESAAAEQDRADESRSPP
ncbi:MAG: hypothetical protein M3401_05825 [Actinomycetota bacterium]|nr:hypothetical protein [Actinomycetota bacterium]